MNLSLENETFDSAPIGIVLTSNRTILMCNQTFCELSEYTKDELIGHSFEMLYCSIDEFNKVRDVGFDALKGGGEYRDQRVLRRKGGSPIWCGFRAKTLTPHDPLARIVLCYSTMENNNDDIVLTARERDVVLGLTRGETSKETGAFLGLSNRTIEDVKSRLLKKYKVRSSAELLWRFARADL